MVIDNQGFSSSAFYLLCMECNKDEAGRAKSIAEHKLEQKDYVGAKKFALKAQSLYPGLEGVSQMLTTLDVYVSAENKISGEVDWYGVLNVDPSADDDTIKRQYRKLALLLHPDKNSSVGADGSFKLILEAWSLLSDKPKRSAYNQRRANNVFQQNAQRHAPRPCQQKVPTRTAGPSAPSGSSQQKVPKHAGGPSAPSGPNQRKGPTRAGGPSASSGPSQQKVPTHTGGPSAPSGPSQQKVPTHTDAPSAPSGPKQQKASTHTAGQSAPSKPSQQKVPTHAGGASAPSGAGQQKVPTHASGSSASSRSSQQKVPSHASDPSTPSRPKPQKASGPSVPSMESQYPNCASRKTSAPKSQKTSSEVPKKPAPAPPHDRSDTFLTTCGRCNTQYKYPKMFSNCTLLCHNCQKSFFASETVPPVNYPKSAYPSRQRTPVDNLGGRNAYDPGRNVPAGQGSLPGDANIGSTKPCTAGEVKRSHTESKGSAGREGCFKKRKIGEPQVRKQRRTCNV